MAYLMRSLALIGIIAFNSPVHGEKNADRADAATREIAQAIGRLEPEALVTGVAAAREAAQILSGLDPQTRSRVLALAAGSARAATAPEPRRNAEPPSR